MSRCFDRLRKGKVTMGTYIGTYVGDTITTEVLSPGVTADPAGTRPSDAADVINGVGGADTIAGGGGADSISFSGEEAPSMETSATTTSPTLSQRPDWSGPTHTEMLGMTTSPLRILSTTRTTAASVVKYACTAAQVAIR